MLKVVESGANPTVRQVVASGRLLYVLPHSAFFTHSGPVGGHISHARGFAAAVVRCGMEVHALGPKGLAPVLEPAGVKCFEVKPTGWPMNLGWSSSLLRAIRAQSQTTEYRACYARYAARFAAYFPALRRALGGVPLVLEINSTGSQRHSWMHMLDARALRAGDLLVTVSASLAEWLSLRFPSICRDRILVLPNGVDLSRFTAANVAPESAGPLRIGYVGVLKDSYGIEDLIAAFARLGVRTNGCELVIVGDGAARARLESQAAGIVGVRFEGPIPAEKVPSCLRSMDILIYTNTRQHGFQSPIKLYEYMAAGRAIIAADTPQVCELFGRRRIGLTYECSNVADLTSKLEFLAADKSLRDELGAAAAAEAVHHSWDSRVRQLWESL